MSASTHIASHASASFLADRGDSLLKRATMPEVAQAARWLPSGSTTEGAESGGSAKRRLWTRSMHPQIGEGDGDCFVSRADYTAAGSLWPSRLGTRTAGWRNAFQTRAGQRRGRSYRCQPRKGCPAGRGQRALGAAVWGTRSGNVAALSSGTTGGGWWRFAGRKHGLLDLCRARRASRRSAVAERNFGKSCSSPMSGAPGCCSLSARRLVHSICSATCPQPTSCRTLVVATMRSRRWLKACSATTAARETTGLLLGRSLFCRRAWEASVSWQRSGHHRQYAGRRGQMCSRCYASGTFFPRSSPASTRVPECLQFVRVGTARVCAREVASENLVLDDAEGFELLSMPPIFLPPSPCANPVVASAA